MSRRTFQQWVKGLFGRSSPLASLAGRHSTSSVTKKEAPLEDILQELRDYIRQQVAAAFDDADEIVQGSVDAFCDQAAEETLRPHAERFTREELENHAALQRTWLAETDCDRLDAAFAELDDSGIVARQNFTCCQNCGHTEIGDEIEANEQKGLHPFGYVFYHMQDTERAVEGAGLYLAYGAQNDSVKVAEQVVATLQNHGLSPKWDGSLKTRIFVPVDWKRRRSP